MRASKQNSKHSEYAIPFAYPIVDSMLSKKLSVVVAKFAKTHHIKKGIRNVTKELKKQTQGYQSSRFCLLAADVTPIDTISHIPVLCEEHSIPYIFFPSKEELGMLTGSMRKTSVLFVMSNLNINKISDTTLSIDYKEVEKLLQIVQVI